MTKMICMRGDYVTFKNGERCYVLKGTSRPHYLITVIGMCSDGHKRQVCYSASEIVKVERRINHKWQEVK